MSLLLNDIQLPLLVKAAIVDHNTLSWNNLDQLSSLRTVFSKCKSNIRDGFRLENLSWRLWYRQSILQKKETPKTSQDINYSSVNQSRSLRRTRSLPNLSQWQPNVASPSLPLKKAETIKLVPSKQPLSSLLPQQRKKQKFFISTDDTQMQPEDQLLFKKTHTTQPKMNSDTTKPVSLLTEMLNGNGSQKTSSGLRRCQSRYGRLDQFFLNAA